MIANVSMVSGVKHTSSYQRRGLVTEERSATTVREVWLSSSRRVFGWGAEHKHVRKNPFVDIKVDVPRKSRSRETKAFTEEEARTILRAALAIKNPKTPFERAKRWVPWLCAYSGARAGKVTQLRGVDIEKRGSFHLLMPDAGTIKTRKTRVVPLHEHLIARGFLEMVRSVGKGALFYDDNPLRLTRTFGPSGSNGQSRTVMFGSSWRMY
jgi:integrase